MAKDQSAGVSMWNYCGSPPRHPLPIRPADRTWPAGRRLRPAPHCRTRVPSYSLKVTPEQHFVNWQQDPHGNWHCALRLPRKDHRVLGRGRFACRYRSHQSLRFFRRALRRHMSVQISRRTCARISRPISSLEPAGRTTEGVARHHSARQPRNTVDFLVDLNQRLQQRVRYLIRMEPGVQTPEETLARTDPDRAATPRGCWCRFCANSDCRRGLFPAISSSSSRI